MKYIYMMFLCAILAVVLFKGYTIAEDSIVKGVCCAMGIIYTIAAFFFNFLFWDEQFNNKQ